MAEYPGRTGEGRSGVVLNIVQFAFAALAQIMALLTLNIIMPACSQFMFAAFTAVGVASLTSMRNVGEVIIAGTLRFRPQSTHDLLPLRSMWFDIAEAIEYIGDVVGNFVGNGSLQTVFHEVEKKMRVVVDATPTPVTFIHASL